jgi:N-ethylmaleimide reductase
VTARGYYGAPGIYTDDQIVGWKKIVDAVHAKGCKIFLQLWHVGRVSHVEMTGGEAPVGPSIITTEAVAFTNAGRVLVSPNRALRTDEFPGIVEAYRAGSERAMKAGFDGVEIHCGNGYLLDQFLQNGTNKRTERTAETWKIEPACYWRLWTAWLVSGDLNVSESGSHPAVSFMTCLTAILPPLSAMWHLN